MTADPWSSPADVTLPMLAWSRMSNVVDIRDQIERVTTAAALPLYRGMLHAVVGEGESGKTWIGAQAALNAAQEMHQVLIIDGEMSAPAWRRRLNALGANSQDLQFIGYAEMDARSVEPDVITATLAAMTAGPSWPAAGLLVWDSALSMLSRTAKSENDNAEVSRVYDKLRDVVRRTNAAGLIVDHVTRGSTSLVSRGATAKFNALDISYGVRLAEGCVPSPIEPWSSVITVEKDRHGLLGKRSDREASFFPLSNGALQLDVTERDAGTHRLSADNPVALAQARITALNPPATSANDAHKQIGGNRTAALRAYKLWKDGNS